MVTINCYIELEFKPNAQGYRNQSSDNVTPLLHCEVEGASVIVVLIM